MPLFLGFTALVKKSGGERGIRTLEGLLTLTPLAGLFVILWLSMGILEIALFIGFLSIRVYGYLQVNSVPFRTSPLASMADPNGLLE